MFVYGAVAQGGMDDEKENSDKIRLVYNFAVCSQYPRLLSGACLAALWGGHRGCLCLGIGALVIFDSWLHNFVYLGSLLEEKRVVWFCPLWFMLIGAGVWTVENLVSGVQSFHQLGAVIIPAVLLYGLPSQVAVVLFYVLQTMLKISDDYAEKLLRENREQQ